MTEKVVNLFAEQQQEEILSPEQIELNNQMSKLTSEQQGLVRKMVMGAYRAMDEAGQENQTITPLVHMPIEASFSLASMYLSIVTGKTEEEAKELYPMVQELSSMIDKTIDEFYTKHGDATPNELVYYGLVNVAVNSLQQERAMINFHELTGESPFQGVTN